MNEFMFDSMYQFIRAVGKIHTTFHLVFNHQGEECLYNCYWAIDGKINVRELHTTLTQVITQDTEYLDHSDIGKIPISSFVGVNIPILSYNHMPFKVCVREVEHVR